jgi:hypothetical protein
MSEEVQVPFGEDREALYAKASVDETAEETTEVSAETTTKEETQESEYKAEPPVKEEADSVSKEDKTVPYGALKEEREKRKAIQKDLDEAQKRLQQVLNDFQSYVQNGNKPDEVVEVIEDYDKELLESKRTIKALQAEVEALKGNFKSEQTIKAQNELQTRISSVSDELVKEGFPGFVQFIGHVQSELSKIASDDMETAKSLDNPDGWKKIYKEKVFPTLSTIFTKKESDDRTSRKVAAKQEVQGAVLTPGQAPASEKSSAEWNYDDYLKVRNTGFAGGLGR